MSKIPSQVDEVYDYMLKHEFINQIIATTELKCTRLAAIICIMKKKLEIPIGSEMKYYIRENGRLGRYKNYWLEYKPNDSSGNQTIG